MWENEFRRIALVVVMITSGQAFAYAQAPALSPGDSSQTKLGPATKVVLSNDKASISMRFTEGKEKLLARCQNVKTILKGASDLTFLQTMLVPSKPTLRIELNAFLPELDPAWKVLVEQNIAKDKTAKLEGAGRPFRPTLLDVAIDFTIDAPTRAELILSQPDFQAVQNDAQAKREELRNNGFLTFEINSVMLPCLILDGRVQGDVSVVGRSFDRVQTRRVMPEADVQDLVRKSEEQIAKDNNPIGFVNDSNLKNFLYFRSVESIGSWTGWLQKERIVYWEKFVDEWSKRLDGKFRPLTDDELKSVGSVLTTVNREPVLFRYDTGKQEIKFRD